MANELNPQSLINVSVNLQPVANSRSNFGTLAIFGDSNVIPSQENYRLYSDLESIANDFGINDPEYLASALYLSQTPRAKTPLVIARWDRVGTPSVLTGGTLSAGEQTLSNFTSITSGTLTISVNEISYPITGINLSAASSLSGVATAIQAAINTASASDVAVAWTSPRFVLTTNDNVSVSYATGTVSTLLKWSSSNATSLVLGSAAEEPVAAVQRLDEQVDFYGLMFAADTMPSESQNLAVAEYVEAASSRHSFKVTSNDPDLIVALDTDDLASQIKALAYKRTSVEYSTTEPYFSAGVFGVAFSVDFSASNSTKNLMFKQIVGVVPENLTATQAQTLKTKNCNVYAAYKGRAPIYQYGTVGAGFYFDDIHGTDWLADAIETEAWNLLYQSKTKIPQTDDGVNQIVSVIVAVLTESTNNGLVAGGQWNADGFGQLNRGDYLSSGFYVYAPPIALQAQSIREQRIAPTIQVAVKLAGAIQAINIIVDVNR
jgi:hypothetical protein